MEPVAVRVHQLTTPLRAGYLVYCPRTRATALVDPLPTVRAAVQELLREHELKLRFVLRTGRGPDREVSRYDKMLAELGLGEGLGEAPADDEPFPDVPRVGPPLEPPQDRSAPEAVVLQAGEGTVGVRRYEGTTGSEPRFTIGGSLLAGTPPTAHICGSARVALGVFFVEVLPIDDDQVAYRIQDRLFTGAAAGHTPPVLLHLPEDTVVHPRRISREDGPTLVSTIAQERRRSLAAEVAEWPG